MGNKLVVDKNCSELSEILSYNTSDLISEKHEIKNSETNYHQNLKIWKIFEDENGTLNLSPVNITMIKEEHFLFNSEEAYIILLVYKANDEFYELSAFPNSIWGIVESSSNMTPRGLKHVFSSSSANGLESLESYILSKRGFKDSDYKFVLFIWNGKKTSPLVKSTLLMRAFDLDKKLSDPTLLPYLYSGYYLNKDSFMKGEYFLLNDVLNNTFENIVNEENSNPSTETFLNFHETVYLLQWLYPIKESIKEKKSNNIKNNVCFPKFNNTFLKSSRNYYDCFFNIEKKVKSNEYNGKTDEDSLYDNHLINGKRSTKSGNNNNFKLKFDFMKMDNNHQEMAEISFKPINTKKVEIPTLKLGIKHKVLNEDIISQRTKGEERLELSSKTLTKINKGSFKINLKKEILDKRDNLSEVKGEPLPIKELDRKELLNMFCDVCSEIIEVKLKLTKGFLYLSGYNVAKSKELLEEYKITHIINSAADVAQNFFEGGNIKYLHYNIKDHSMENIECLFYEVIYFIEEVRNQGGRVLIHCMQGVSRSVSLIICYLIFTKKYNFDEALNFVIEKRAIAGPNFGFGIQLQYFYKRLYEPPESFRVFPKIFAVASYQAEQLDKVMIDNFLTSKSFRSFDKRGIFIVVTYTVIYIWIGSQIKESMSPIYYKTAKNYITMLQKHESAPLVVREINDGYEGEEFFSLWREELNKNKQAIFSDIVQDWNVWYKEADFSKKPKEKICIVEENFITRKSFFRYPEYEIPETIFDFDDIGENTFIIGCYINQKDNKYQMFLYKTLSFTIDETEEQKFINNVKNFFFIGFNKDGVEYLEQTPYDEDEEFISLFM